MLFSAYTSDFTARKLDSTIDFDIKASFDSENWRLLVDISLNLTLAKLIRKRSFIIKEDLTLSSKKYIFIFSLIQFLLIKLIFIAN